MEMVRRINHKAPHYYMGQCPQLACNTEASIEMPAHLSILPVAQRFEGFARNDDTRKTIPALRKTLIKSLPNFILGLLYRVRNHSTRIASYLRRMMTKPCIKIHMKSDSAI